jgi:hypothetical protein
VGRGSWVTVDEMIAYLATQEKPASAPTLTQSLLRKHYLSNFSRLLQLFVIPTGDPDSLWAARIGLLQQHWRKTFRLVPQWRDRLLALFPHRVAVWDRETQQRAISLVHCNYITRPSWRGLTVKKSQRHDQGWTVRAYAESLDAAKAAPFTLRMIDPDLMIFHIEPQLDSWGESEAVAPGSTSQIPSLCPAEANQAAEAYRALWEWVPLDISWKLSTVLTGVRATPNSHRRLHRVRIEASQVAKKFPGAKHTFKARGPEMDIRVLPGLMTAKFMWKDEETDRIKGAFIKDTDVPVDSLLLNKDHVDDVAQAMAARVSEMFLTRVEGDFRTRMKDLRPTGSLTAVTQRLEPDGRLSSICSATLPITPRDLFPVLDPSTRKYLLHVLYQQG